MWRAWCGRWSLVLEEARDPIRHDRRAPLAQGAEEIRVRDQAEALIPGVVAGREVPLDVEVRPDARQRGAREPRADCGRDFGDRHRLREGLLRSVG